MRGSEEPWCWKWRRMISQRLYAMLRVYGDGKSVTDRAVRWKADVYTYRHTHTHAHTAEENECESLDRCPCCHFLDNVVDQSNKCASVGNTHPLNMWNINLRTCVCHSGLVSLTSLIFFLFFLPLHAIISESVKNLLNNWFLCCKS